MLHRGAHSSSHVDGRLLRPITNKMESRKCAGQVALGHVFVVFLFKFSGAVRRILGGFSSRCVGRDPHFTIDNDAVHGLRAAPEPDAALRQAAAVPEFITLVEQDLSHVEFSSYQ